jgi:hypothetical protein
MPEKTDRILRSIVLLRGEKVMLDRTLAELYGVETRVLTQAIKRNRARFPSDFVFQLTWAEAEPLAAQWVISEADSARGGVNEPGSRSQTVILKRGRNVKYLPYAFTEHGVAMLSSVLRSPRAIQVNIEIIRSFVELRRMLATNADLARRLAILEKRYDARFKAVFDAIRQLMAPSKGSARRIGFNLEPG